MQLTQVLLPLALTFVLTSAAPTSNRQNVKVNDLVHLPKGTNVNEGILRYKWRDIDSSMNVNDYVLGYKGRDVDSSISERSPKQMHKPPPNGPFSFRHAGKVVLKSLVRWAAGKEAQDFLATDAGKSFASKLASIEARDETISARDLNDLFGFGERDDVSSISERSPKQMHKPPPNGPFSFRHAGKVVLKSLVRWAAGKEAQDFLATDAGKSFASKLASIEARDETISARDLNDLFGFGERDDVSSISERSPKQMHKPPPNGPFSFRHAGKVVLKSLVRWAAGKEAQDFLATDAGKSFASKLASIEARDETISARDLNDLFGFGERDDVSSISERSPKQMHKPPPNGPFSFRHAGKVVLKSLVRWAAGKEAQDFLATDAGKSFASKLASIEARDETISARDLNDLFGFGERDDVSSISERSPKQMHKPPPNGPFSFRHAGKVVLKSLVRWAAGKEAQDFLATDAGKSFASKLASIEARDETISARDLDLDELKEKLSYPHILNKWSKQGEDEESVFAVARSHPDLDLLGL